MAFDPNAAARAVAEAHENRTPFNNLAGTLEPPTIADAYAAQEALIPLWQPGKGSIAGLKIATTTKVMQQLMGIDHPCGGIIYENTVHRSGVTLRRADFINLVIECELAVRLGKDLPDTGKPYTREEVRSAIGAVLPAFELIEDRAAVYKETDARSLIADNAWNGGIVIGAEAALPVGDLSGIPVRVTRSSADPATGRSDDPLGALAWVANLAVSRGRPMRAGMLVITGSIVPTFPVEPGEEVQFEIDGIGRVEIKIA